jgi:TetR/AcrR family transcriptional regulator, regulator of cefoperazone and chloramphenicol sensitivity
MDREGRRPRRDTRTAIIEAAMHGFAEKGFDATSTREIASIAGTNIASISYHFGGKGGLRAACAEHVVELMGEVLPAADAPLPADPEAARQMLDALVRRMVDFLLLEPRARLIAGFILRELSQPSGALDTIYDGLFVHVHRHACTIWATATGREAESEAVRLAVFALIGQVVYFHVGRPIVQRRMGWDAIGTPEAAAIADTVAANVMARLDSDRRKS